MTNLKEWLKEMDLNFKECVCFRSKHALHITAGYRHRVPGDPVVWLPGGMRQTLYSAGRRLGL